MTIKPKFLILFNLFIIISVKKNEICFVDYRGKTFVGDYLWASENVNIINAFK